MLIYMQTVDIDFQPSIVEILRQKISEIKTSKKPLISVDINFISRIVEEQQNSLKNTHEYLSDLSNLS